MPDPVDAPDTSPVVDRRPVPRGVLPRGIQTWLMAGLAVGILGIILLTGHRDQPPTPRPTVPTTEPVTADRVRDYQDRLRQLDEQSAREVREAVTAPPTVADEQSGSTSQPVDPLVDERRRREYESLFASNVVFSRRPDGQRPDVADRRASAAPDGTRPVSDDTSIDDIADAVVRATARTARAVPQSPSAPDSSGESPTPRPDSDRSPVRATDRISAVGPLHRVLEGTVIDTVLTNRLDGSAAAPLNCLVTNAVYSHSGHQVLIPAGARVLGETRPVQSIGQTRLAVLFHRLLMPDGSTRALDQFKGLNQIGDAGLRDRVNHHYWSTFGAAGAVGLISGLAQLLGTAGTGLGDGDRTVIVAGGAADAASQASAQVLNRFLNRLPTITIREGHRVKVYVTSDLDLPEWSPVVSSLFAGR
jgi:type IV secretion system protein TrbI